MYAIVSLILKKASRRTKTKTHGNSLVKGVDPAGRKHVVEFADLHSLVSVRVYSDIDLLNRQALCEYIVLRECLLLGIFVLKRYHLEAGENLQCV
jgi:hypothetical protein